MTMTTVHSTADRASTCVRVAGSEISPGPACSFMTMGDEGDASEEEIDSPRRGEQLVPGSDSYAGNELYTRSRHGGGSGGGGQKHATELYRMEDDKAEWDASLDVDVASAAVVIAEQMQSNTEEGGQTALHAAEDVGAAADPLGLGVLSAATLTLEASNASTMQAATRRNVRQLARHQASTMMLEPSTSQQARPPACPLAACGLCKCHAQGTALPRHAPRAWPLLKQSTWL
jgi:hypothetical protein